MTDLGKISKIYCKKSYTIGLTVLHNLPSHIIVNHGSVTPKADWMSVILVHTTNMNTWTQQPLLAAKAHEMEV